MPPDASSNCSPSLTIRQDIHRLPKRGVATCPAPGTDRAEYSATRQQRRQQERQAILLRIVETSQQIFPAMRDHQASVSSGGRYSAVTMAITCPIDCFG
ncbi:hypothetical protein Pden_3589 [Paracoccus denitrificans PD1222]|uniref:Uncharacterized protein n=1 Tax=Paracoccus denitrificans (strain Pd 1222) TaxID=318586 RepID=A1B813_PARDP|nr:hypothetical protein Pden_3589 [Paracoccus denitrificans PD1222]